jgi:hypothetical protein
LDELEALTGISYLCVLVDSNKPKNQITVLNSLNLDDVVLSVSKIFGGNDVKEMNLIKFFKHFQ